MSYNDKRQLVRDVSQLRGTGHLSKIMKIIARQMPFAFSEVSSRCFIYIYIKHVTFQCIILVYIYNIHTSVMM